MPLFPGKMRWFMSFVQAVKSAVMQIWTEEPDEQRARAVASTIFAIRPLPEDWFGRWIPAVRRTLLADFALPTEIADRAKARAYHE
jgi:hypothetical protein